MYKAGLLPGLCFSKRHMNGCKISRIDANLAPILPPSAVNVFAMGLAAGDFFLCTATGA
jgi:hypothetical protein